MFHCCAMGYSIQFLKDLNESQYNQAHTQTQSISLLINHESFSFLLNAMKKGFSRVFYFPSIVKRVFLFVLQPGT